MGIFDFLNNKKKEKARQEQLRLQEEKRRTEEQRRLAERRKQEEQQRREESFLSNFEFDSTCHQRYENGQPVRVIYDFVFFKIMSLLSPRKIAI